MENVKKDKKKNNEFNYVGSEFLSEKLKEEKMKVKNIRRTIKFINSEYFNDHLVLYYLHHNQDIELIEFLIEKLLKVDVVGVLSIILQIIQIYLYQDIPSMFIFHLITGLSKKSVKFSIISSWLLETSIKSALFFNSKVNSKAKRLIQEIITLNVYLSHQNKSNIKEPCFDYTPKAGIPYSAPERMKDSSSISNLESYVSENMTDIDNFSNSDSPFINVKSFFSALVHLSQKLLSVPEHFRSSQLHIYINEISSKITNGLFVPWVYYPEHILLQITPYNSIVLGSKDKVPFLMFAEVLEYTEGSDENKINYNKRMILEKINKNSLADKESKESTNSIENIIYANSIRQRLLAVAEANNYNYNGYSIEKNEEDNQNQAEKPRRESWKEKLENIRKTSPFSHIAGWNVYPVIVKSGDDLRQDLLAFQLLKKCQEVWSKENVNIWVKPYEIVVISNNSGLIEAVKDTISLNHMKKNHKTLITYFKELYGEPGAETFTVAQKNFIKSLAGYSLFQYVFLIKDRHNSNILLDKEGHLIHIDFGFMLGVTPKNLSFEKSPFKMTQEYVDLMGGIDSDLFLYFRSLMFHGMFVLRKHMEEFFTIIEILRGSDIECINSFSLDSFKARFHIGMPDNLFAEVVDNLIRKSLRSYTTIFYDKFQYYTNGIL